MQYCLLLPMLTAVCNSCPHRSSKSNGALLVSDDARKSIAETPLISSSNLSSDDSSFHTIS